MAMLYYLKRKFFSFLLKNANKLITSFKLFKIFIYQKYIKKTKTFFIISKFSIIYSSMLFARQGQF